jgi:hypothetical protein
MEEGDNDNAPQLSEDEWHDVVTGVFEDVFEQHGLGSAVAMFLAALGQWAAETETIPQLAISMSCCLETASELQKNSEPKSVN